jgi:hypothetical protein
VEVLAPTKLRRSAPDRKQETDERDAGRLLEVRGGPVLAGDRLPAVWIADPQTRDDRELVRGRLDVGEKLSGVKALLKRKGVSRVACSDWMGDTSWHVSGDTHTVCTRNGGCRDGLSVGEMEPDNG